MTDLGRFSGSGLEGANKWEILSDRWYDSDGSESEKVSSDPSCSLMNGRGELWLRVRPSGMEMR